MSQPEQSDIVKRTRILTEKGNEQYRETQEKHCNTLNNLWKSVDLLLNNSVSPFDQLNDLQCRQNNLEYCYEGYLKQCELYAEFLVRTNTINSQKDFETHIALLEVQKLSVKDTLTKITNQIRLIMDADPNKSDVSSHKSRSSCSRMSDISSILARKKAKAEAAKAKAEYANREAILRKKQAAVNEQQQLLTAQTTRIHAELVADLECLKIEGLAAESAAEVKVLQSIEDGSDKDDLTDISLPHEETTERTKRFVENYSTPSYGGHTRNIPVPTRERERYFQNGVDHNSSYDLPYHLGIPRLQVPIHGGHNIAINIPEVPSLSDVEANAPPKDTATLNPTALPYRHADNIAYQSMQQQNEAITHELTTFLLKKELLLTRLSSFNDQPEAYISWKAGFINVVQDLKPTSTEQVDLLVRWLGPESVKQARSLKSANMEDPSRALHLIWERLDERFGAPEIVESALKSKLECFPKLTNKDTKQLYELYDILAEIESIKRNDKFKALLAYYDSSSGILPIIRKLPYNLQEKWTSRASDFKRRHNVPFPPFSYFVEYIKEISRTRNDPCFAYEVAPNMPNKKTDSTMKFGSTRVNFATRKTDMFNGSRMLEETMTVCPLHNTKHSLNDCRTFKGKSLQERKVYLKENGICFRCCSSTKHQAKACENSIQCKDCSSNQHPSALHVVKPNDANSKVVSGRSYIGGEKDTQTLNSKCTQICGKQFKGKSCGKNILVTVHPRGSPEKARRMYVILDEQSNVSLARSEFFDMFEEQGQRTPYTLSSCNGQTENVGRRTQDYIIKALDGSGQVETSVIVECDQIPDMREEIPTPEVALFHPHLADIATSIPPIDPDAKILLLIGRDVPDAHHVQRQLTGARNEPFAQRLPLGWVIVGEACLGKLHRPDYSCNKTSFLKDGQPSYFTPCDKKLDVKEKHGTTESPLDFNNEQEYVPKVFELTKNDNKKGTSVEDRQFLQIMNENMVKTPQGNWTAPLPFRTPRDRLPNNRSQAMKRAKTLHNSLLNDPVKKEHFFAFMAKILDNGHAELARPLQEQECWYLPLFCVYHPRKPDQIRGVFDSSAKHYGISLNDAILSGPDSTNSLLGILLRFRDEPIAVTADIERMFYCFYVRDDHRDYLRFLWYKENDFRQQLVEYRMKVHVFGNSPSPAVATYGLRKAAQEGIKDGDQDVIDFVNRDFYVDDALTSLPTVQQAVSLVKRTQQALLTGGNVRLHKIASNSQKVMDAFPSDDHAKDLKDLDMGTDLVPLQRSLGLTWDVKSDTITYRLSSERKSFSRRGVLSTINSLFDPIGFVAPIVVRGKMLLRELMTETIDWDEPLPAHQEKQWENWRESLQCVQDLQIRRAYAKPANDANNDVCIFSDASEKAIAAAAYLRTSDDRGREQFSFVLGKAKLAPLHGHTIPRLELCATVLATEIGEIVSEHLDVNLGSIRYYTDSKIVLGYLHNTTRRFHVYVSNRVERVHRSSSPQQWSYISTESNPADNATRDTPTVDIAINRWLLGPLKMSANPSDTFPLCNPGEDKDIRQVVTMKTTLSDATLDMHRCSRFSSWGRLIGAMARLKHVAKTFHNGHPCKGWHTCRESSTPKLKAETETVVIKQVQSEMYRNEIQCLHNKKVIPRNSSIASLSPFLDEEGLLRVGGRLNRSNLGLQGRNPVIIPSKHHIATLLIRHHHEAIRHQGRHLTEGAIRAAGLWIIGCKRMISSICHDCVKCRKLRAAASCQLMSDLPPERLTPAPPFTYVGVDTFGHWTIITRRTRGGSSNSKRWAIVFSCLVTRAIHLEVVEEMTSSAFINALRRFLSIRGKVKQFYSDRGTNFVGAVKELNITAINVEDETVRQFLNDRGVEWIFNPPHSSHMGGSWERMIGITRRILDSMLMDVSAKNLTHDVLVTFLAEVCAIINARPLVPVSNDPESPFLLSPNMLLTQKSDLPTEPLMEYDVKDMYGKQWKRVQLLAEIFWKRWRQEYLHILQIRRKWRDVQPNIEKGDVVLLKDKNLHRNDWSMGVIADAIPSSDQKIRKAVVRVARSGKVVLYTRPITEMVLLLPKKTPND